MIDRFTRVVAAGFAAAGTLAGLSGCGRIGFELLDPPEAGVVPSRDAGADASPRDAAGDADPPDAGAPEGGMCSTACDNDHGSSDCSSGMCLFSCAIGYDDCDADPGTGCETRVAEAADSCGECGVQCRNDHGATSCAEGLCAPRCDVDYGDCDGDPENGCETQLLSASACGACDTTCTNAHGPTSCPSGNCEPSCDTGYDDCDGDPENGCETDIFNDPSHCGSCTDSCGTNGQICVDGSCEASPCGSGLGECDADLSVTCETDLNNDVDHCNFCGNACSTLNGTPACSGGSCGVASCNPGFDDCDGDPAGCEANLNTNTQHCGACNDPCSNAHGSTRCDAGICDPSCSTGWDSCDGNVDNGCETSLDTISNCGTCGNACPDNGGTAFCNNGVCDTRCDLSGTWALYMQLSGSWPRAGVIGSGSGTFGFWMRVEANHSGNSASIQLTECGRTVPPFGAWQVPEDFLYGFPNSLFDNANLPSSPGALNLADSTLDSSLSLPPIAVQLGLSMNDPVLDPWPSQASGIPSGNRRDMDGDGHAGVTATYSNAGSYDYPRTSSLFFGYNRADRAYVASRVAFSLDGALNGCTQSSGSASFTHADARIFGCRRSGGDGTCSAGEADYLDDNALNYDLHGASYTLEKVSNGASCAAIRSALP